jgi:hypothetical protein
VNAALHERRFCLCALLGKNFENFLAGRRNQRLAAYRLKKCNSLLSNGRAEQALDVEARH